MECFASVIDPKGSHTNKNRYVVATQDPKIRAYLRTIPGVPVIYIKRSVMIMEPMGGATERVKEKEEKAKFKAGIIGSRVTVAGQKRKREGEEVPDDGGDEGSSDDEDGKTASSEPAKPKIKKNRGNKGPNPLSMKKAKKPTTTESSTGKSTTTDVEGKSKRRRVRKRPVKIADATTETEAATTNNEAT